MGFDEKSPPLTRDILLEWRVELKVIKVCFPRFVPGLE